MNRLAPSLKLKATGNSEIDRYPFSVKPDKKLAVQDVMGIMRDFYQDTEFDVTQHPAFNPGGKKSPLARPWGSGELFDLLGIKVERCIGTESSNYVFINQIRDWLPDPLGACMWFTYGPAYTGCFLPLYAGVTDLPEAWSRPPDFARIDRSQVQWSFRLVQNLVNIKYQEAIRDIELVSRAAETRFMAFQPEFEKEAVRIFSKEGAAGVQKFVTEYAAQNLMQVGYAYGELVDYLMLKYLCMYPEVAPLKLPRIAPPAIPLAAGS
jgi:dipeptidase